MLGDASLPGGTGGIGTWPSASAPDAAPVPSSQLLPAIGSPGIAAPSLPPHETWGLISVPMQPPLSADSAGDPALSIYLAFLRAFLQTDQNAIALWAALGPGRPVVKRVHPHNPSDDDAWPEGLGFSTSDLPCLFMWRSSAGHGSRIEWIAEDWQVDISTMKILWVFPTSTKHQQKIRQSYANALAKCVIDAIELGRSPSFVIPGDPEVAAATIGSYVHSYTGIMWMRATEYAARSVRIAFPNDGSPQERYPAVEISFEYAEHRVEDPNRWSAPTALWLSVVNGQQPLPNWEPGQYFKLNDVILAGPPSRPLGFLYKATTVSGAGQSAQTVPVWTTATGSTVSDGAGGSAIVWTCQGTAFGPTYVVNGDG